MIKVHFFASLSEQLDLSLVEVQPDTQKPISIPEVWAAATGGKPMASNVLIAINQEYAKIDTAVNDGDEVAFFPPVTGG